MKTLQNNMTTLNQAPVIIDANRPYYLIDLQSKSVITTGKYSNRTRLRNRAEKMNLEFGAHRYYCTPYFK